MSDSVEIRATAYAAPTLHGPVRVLGDLTGTRVAVETLPGGVGGWARPGVARLRTEEGLAR